MYNTQQDPQGWDYTVNTDEHNPHNHTLPPYDLTVFGALPKINLGAVWQNCKAAKAIVDDSDLVLTKLIADTEALAERCEKLQNILAMLADMTVEN